MTSRSGGPRIWRCGPPGCCDVVEVPARQGLEAVDILRRQAAGDAVGLVLHDDGGGTLGFVVPSGTAAWWDLPGTVCARTGSHGPRPVAEACTAEPSAEDSERLLPPEGTDRATDPAALREALGEAQRLIDTMDGCR